MWHHKYRPQNYAFPIVDNAEISSEVELRVVREFGLPDELATHIFKQNPDLIEVESSSGSSKQSTLSKVSFLTLSSIVLYCYLSLK